jgi:hypothetical protein
MMMMMMTTTTRKKMTTIITMAIEKGIKWVAGEWNKFEPHEYLFMNRG